ncbi:glutathione S-transferase family protein [Halothece sp. PCC 7418]|uniref:glutathione S-transferase family protein n=1 Tax=Halothece sp. (strain PCC 7418) TaxID=65093 RepID=UPI001C0A9256|nr:glutathione S-transferase family protein [Halothece sp. PCC 7418]
MVMKLYYLPLTRASRPHWLLEELEISYELIQVTPDEMSEKPEYKGLHPHGKIPVLVDDNITIHESAGICAYLADQYPDKQLAPSLMSPARGYYYQWLFYAAVTLEPPVERYLFHVFPHLSEKVLPDSEYENLSKDETLHWFGKVCQPLNDHLKENQYLVENQFTAADVITGGVLFWAFKIGLLKKKPP